VYELFVAQELNMVVGRALKCLPSSSATLVPEMAEFKLPSRQLTQVAKMPSSRLSGRQRGRSIQSGRLGMGPTNLRLHKTQVPEIQLVGCDSYTKQCDAGVQ
jgi:hypothetical protein